MRCGSSPRSISVAPTDWQTIYQSQQARDQAFAPSSTLVPKSGTPLAQAIASLANPLGSAVSADTGAVVNNAYQQFASALTQRESAWKKISALAPNDASTQLSLAQAAQDAADTKTAIAAYKAYIRLAPADSGVPAAKKALKQLEASLAADRREREHQHDDHRQVNFPAGMKNPFRTEAAAFHFLWGTIGYFGLIAIASLINTWAGVVVFVLETGILVGWWLTTRGDSDVPEKQVAPPHPPGEKRLLVIANETVGGSELLAELKRHARDARPRCSWSRPRSTHRSSTGSPTRMVHARPPPSGSRPHSRRCGRPG